MNSQAYATDMHYMRMQVKGMQKHMQTCIHKDTQMRICAHTRTHSQKHDERALHMCYTRADPSYRECAPTEMSR